MVLLLILGVAVALVAVGLAIFAATNARERWLFGVFAVLGGGLLISLSFIRCVPANSVGVPVTFGKIGQPKDSGISLNNPFTDVTTFSTRLQELTEEDDNAISLRGSDGYQMNVDVTIRYYVRRSAASELFRRVGSMDGVKDRIVRPEVRDGVREVFGLYTSEAAYSTERAQVGTQVADVLRVRLERFGIDLDSVALRDVRPEERLANAIGERAAAREKALQATIEQQRLITEAETRKQVAERDAAALKTSSTAQADAARVLGQGEADANLLISRSLTAALADYIRAKALASAQTIYVPVDANLFITAGQSPKP